MDRHVARAAVAALALVAAAAVPARATARPLLPDLVALPTANLFVGGAGDAYVTRTGATVFGCHPSEVANDTPTPARCLRFETRIANLGDGPLELHYRADEIAGARGVVQRVYASDGSSTDRDAGTYVVDPAHAHFHYDAFAVASLWRSDSRGHRLGRTPVRTGRKAGFCLEDVYQYRAGASSQYLPPLACYPNTVEPRTGELSQVNGITPGWVDVYDVSVPHQYVEITGVPDGYYLLEITVDVAHRLRERTTANDTVRQLVRLCGDTAEIVGRGPSLCGRGAVPPVTFDGSPHLSDRLSYCSLRLDRAPYGGRS